MAPVHLIMTYLHGPVTHQDIYVPPAKQTKCNLVRMSWFVGGVSDGVVVSTVREGPWVYQRHPTV